MLVCGLAASGVGLAVLAGAGTTSPMWVIEVGLGLLGVGIGLTMPPAAGAIMSSLPPHKAGVGSAVNDLVRELGGAFGIGVLGSLTLSRYRSRLGPALAHQPAQAATQARTGLAQALASLGGAQSTGGLAARHAYSPGVDLAMIISAVVLATAVFLALPARKQLPGAQTPASPGPVDGHLAVPDPSLSKVAGRR